MSIRVATTDGGYMDMDEAVKADEVTAVEVVKKTQLDVVSNILETIRKGSKGTSSILTKYKRLQTLMFKCAELEKQIREEVKAML
jgi:hypothetical protein